MISFSLLSLYIFYIVIPLGLVTLTIFSLFYHHGKNGNSHKNNGGIANDHLFYFWLVMI